jgi:gluconolactonase
VGAPYAQLTPRLISRELEFPEGPVALADGSILVAEVRGGRLTRVDPSGRRTSFAVPGGGPNGTALGPGGAVYICNNGGAQWAERAWPFPDPDSIRLLLPSGPDEGEACAGIQRVDPDGGPIASLYTECRGRPLQRPNDIVFDDQGGFWFTDTGAARGRGREYGGVFYAAADGSHIEEAIHPLEMPNGIGLSPDGRTLYIVETRTRRLWACALARPGAIESRRGLTTIPSGGPLNFGGCDSLCVDADGNVIVATIGRGGLTVVSPDGDTVAHVPVDDPMTTNACFGGPDLRTLYVTAGTTGRLLAFDDWPVAGLPLAYG